jgi:maleylacetate reductase
VLAWNETVNAERQKTVSAQLGRPGEPASAAMRAFVEGLRVPARLGDVGIGRADLADLAARYDGTGPISTNPRPVRGPQDLAEILELAL